MTQSLQTIASSSPLGINGSTKVVGLFGDSVSYTFSPKMHNFAFRELGLNFFYLPFHVQPKNLKGAVESIRNLNFSGVNVTIPHKEKVISYLDELEPLAKKVGAVNTIVNRQGKLVGYNTDVYGFLNSLKEDGKFDPKNKRALIFGAGGTARAISIALLESGVKELTIINRTFQRAQDLVNHLKKNYSLMEINACNLAVNLLSEKINRCDLFLNATPTGMESTASSLPLEKFLLPHLFVFDAVYARVTPILLSAKKMGLRCLDGLGMLAYQGALSFSLWTGLEPPINLMKKALEKINDSF